MKALVYKGPEQLHLEDVPKPHLGRDEVLIRIEAVGICGSELEGYSGHSSIRIPPLIMGHEFCGIVESSDTDSGLIGERVVVNPLIACGICDRCRQGKLNICRERKIIGIHRPGAFAEYVNVPLRNVYKVPLSLDPITASLVEPLAVCVHALKIENGPIQRAVIFGAGPIGLLTLQAARAMGVDQVMVIDKQIERLRFAEQWGAVTATPEVAAERLLEQFGGQGVDTIIDCVGVQSTREQSMRFINPGGKIIMVGLGHDQTTLSLNHLVRQEISIIGSYTYTNQDFEQALQLLADGRIRIDNWVGTMNLKDGPDAFSMLIKNRSPYSKIVLTPKNGGMLNEALAR